MVSAARLDSGQSVINVISRQKTKGAQRQKADKKLDTGQIPTAFWVCRPLQLTMPRISEPFGRGFFLFFGYFNMHLVHEFVKRRSEVVVKLVEVAARAALEIDDRFGFDACAFFGEGEYQIGQVFRAFLETFDFFVNDFFFFIGYGESDCFYFNIHIAS
jgi:hypothetical protein